MTRTRDLAGRIAAIAVLKILTVAASTSNAAQNAPADVRSLVERLSESIGATGRVHEATPIAEAAETERGKASDASKARALERVGYHEFDPERILAPVSAEVPEVWIGWYVNRSIDAFRVAINRNVPFVLVVSEDWCEYCANLATNSLRCAAVERFAGDAVFALSSPSRDRGAFAIADSLEIEAYPTIAVLEPEARMLLERGRINGYFESSKLGEHLETILWRTPPRVYVSENGVPENPPGNWTPTERIGSELNASFGAKNRGLKHASPEPQCK